MNTVDFDRDKYDGNVEEMTVQEVEKLELSLRDWNQLESDEKEGKNRTDVLRVIEEKIRACGLPAYIEGYLDIDYDIYRS